MLDKQSFYIKNVKKSSTYFVLSNKYFIFAPKTYKTTLHMSLRKFRKYLKNRSLYGFRTDDYMEVLQDKFGGSMSLINGSDNHLIIRVRHRDKYDYRLQYLIEDDENIKGFKHLTLLSVVNEEMLQARKKISDAVSLINDFILYPTQTTKEVLLAWLTEYVHTSHRIFQKKVSFQPSFPKKKVVDVKSYADAESFGYYHKTNRLLLTFDDNTEYEISLYKFKRFAKREWYTLSRKIEYYKFLKAAQS